MLSLIIMVIIIIIIIILMLCMVESINRKRHIYTGIRCPDNQFCIKRRKDMYESSCSGGFCQKVPGNDSGICFYSLKKLNYTPIGVFYLLGM